MAVHQWTCMRMRPCALSGKASTWVLRLTENVVVSLVRSSENEACPAEQGSCGPLARPQAAVAAPLSHRQ